MSRSGKPARIVDTRLAYLQRELPKTGKRAVASTVRSVIPEAARLISADILNLPARQISPYLKARVDEGTLTVSASRGRVPLQAFKPRVTARNGVTVTTWRDGGAKHLPHAFRRKDGKAGIWQRIPFTAGGKFGSGHQSGGGPSGLVHRLPIVERKGPSMARIFEAKHGDINPRLTVYVQARLSEELARMLKAGL